MRSLECYKFRLPHRNFDFIQFCKCGIPNVSRTRNKSTSAEIRFHMGFKHNYYSGGKKKYWTSVSHNQPSTQLASLEKKTWVNSFLCCYEYLILCVYCARSRSNSRCIEKRIILIYKYIHEGACSVVSLQWRHRCRFVFNFLCLPPVLLPSTPV